jgi:hypothetical protein
MMVRAFSGAKKISGQSSKVEECVEDWGSNLEDLGMQDLKIYLNLIE